MFFLLFFDGVFLRNGNRTVRHIDRHQYEYLSDPPLLHRKRRNALFHRKPGFFLPGRTDVRIFRRGFSGFSLCSIKRTNDWTNDRPRVFFLDIGEWLFSLWHWKLKPDLSAGPGPLAASALMNNDEESCEHEPCDRPFYRYRARYLRSKYALAWWKRGFWRRTFRVGVR